MPRESVASRGALKNKTLHMWPFTLPTPSGTPCHLHPAPFPVAPPPAIASRRPLLPILHPARALYRLPSSLPCPAPSSRPSLGQSSLAAYAHCWPVNSSLSTCLRQRQATARQSSPAACPHRPLYSPIEGVMKALPSTYLSPRSALCRTKEEG